MFKKNKKEEKHGFISLDPFPGEGHMICSWQQRAGLNHTGVCVCECLQGEWVNGRVASSLG